ALSQRLDHCPDSGMKSLGVGVTVAGSRDVNELGKHAVRPITAKLLDVEVDVIADRFREASRGNPDQLGSILADHVLQPLVENLPAAVHGRRFAEIGGRDIHRLAKVADQVAPYVRRATLRAVEQGDGPLDAPEDKAGAQRRADVAGIPGGRKATGWIVD